MTDPETLMQRPIAVLGAGATGQAHAADCALAGREVRLAEVPDFEATLEPFRSSRRLRLDGPEVNKHGFKRHGAAEIDVVTTDVGEAVEGAGLVVVSVAAVGHDAFFDALVPHLEDGMVVHIFPDNFGSLLLRRKMRDAGIDADVVVGGWSSQPYGVRIKREGGVALPELHVIYRAITLRGAALPANDDKRFLRSLKALPSMDPVVDPVLGDTVLDVGFSNVNPVLHVPGTLLSLGAMENFGRMYGDDPEAFSIYSHGFCESIAEVQVAFYREVRAIAEALGVGVQDWDEDDFRQRDSILGQEYLGDDAGIPFDKPHPLLVGTGPFSVDNRYLTEDIPVGCHVFAQLGDACGLDTPVIDALITLGSVVTGRDLRAEGVSLETLGIAGLDPEALGAYLREGTPPAG